MPIVLYDTRQRRKVPFEPLEAGTVKMYTCGQTVYDDAHIGNFRTYIFEDLLRRSLKFLGYQVVQVMNLTDVDDKTIRESCRQGIPLKEYTAPIIERFFEDLDTLGIERAEHYPAATDHVPEMIALIQTLLEKGYAYQAEGSVYFSVSRFKDYGQLSGMSLERLAKGVRIDADEYEKDDFRDFALWKGRTPEDGEVSWEAPFGRGRPGWHIECSAMSMRYLGEEFDIHTGGVDNIFPHHENEIAQSVAATGKGFARYWLHSAHLVVDGEKMSKSLGNFYTVKDLLAKGYPPRAIRYVLLSVHYRQPLNFTDEVAQAAMRSLERFDTLYQAAVLASGGGKVRNTLREALDNTRQGFASSLQDDLGIAEAMADLFKLVSTVHQLAQEKPLNRAEGVALKALWGDVDRVLGLLIPEETGISGQILDAVRNRERLRRSHDFAQADRIRVELNQRGIQLEDTTEGTVAIWPGGRRIVRIEDDNS